MNGARTTRLPPNRPTPRLRAPVRAAVTTGRRPPDQGMPGDIVLPVAGGAEPDRERRPHPNSPPTPSNAAQAGKCCFVPAMPGLPAIYPHATIREASARGGQE